MKIETIKIRNYRVFQDVTVEDIPNMAVFLGMNGAGKTTFFDVFGFFIWRGHCCRWRADRI